MDETSGLEHLRAAAQGDTRQLGEVLEGFRGRLERMVSLRLDPRLRGRIEPRDVLQETFVEVVQRLEEYLADPDMDFFLWVRFLAGQKLLQLHRTHLGAAARDARREVPLLRRVPDASSLVVASAILDLSGTPSRAAMKSEREEALAEALDRMSETDREVLVLRHFEQLGNTEIAGLLEISPSAASQRYFRALAHLREILEELNLSPDVLG